MFEFPKGGMLTFSSRLGSGPESDYEVFYGQPRTLDSRDWTSRPADNTRPRYAQNVVLPDSEAGADAALTAGGARPHVANWIECLGSRKQPHAPIDVGLARVRRRDRATCWLAGEEPLGWASVGAVPI